MVRPSGTGVALGVTPGIAIACTGFLRGRFRGIYPFGEPRLLFSFTGRVKLKDILHCRIRIDIQYLTKSMVDYLPESFALEVGLDPGVPDPVIL